MEELQRDFKWIFIPKEIWFDENLTALDKVILAELDSLDSSEEWCFASNSYLAKFCQCSEIKITTTITKLVNLWYIKIAKFDGRKRYVKSNISRVIKNIRQSYKKYKSDLYKIWDINIDYNTDYKKEKNKEKFKDNNTRENNIKREYFEDDTLNTSFLEFIEHRKEIKAKMTDLAIEKLVNKIKKRQQKYTNMQIIAFIDESIENGWKWVFEREIKNEKKERTEAEKKEMFKFAEQITKMWNNNKKTRADDLFF